GTHRASSSTRTSGVSRSDSGSRGTRIPSRSSATSYGSCRAPTGGASRTSSSGMVAASATRDDRVARIASLTISAPPAVSSDRYRFSFEKVAADYERARPPYIDAAVDWALEGQAFHWFETEKALSEMHRVLRPRGGFALLWNHFNQDDPLLGAV